MQRACAAERDEREVARVEPLLDRDDTQRAHHLRVHDVDDRSRVELPEHAPGGVGVQLDASGQLGGSRPSSRLASVTVARSPPFP